MGKIIGKVIESGDYRRQLYCNKCCVVAVFNDVCPQCGGVAVPQIVRPETTYRIRFGIRFFHSRVYSMCPHQWPHEQ